MNISLTAIHLTGHIFNGAGQQVKMDNPADDEQLFG